MKKILTIPVVLCMCILLIQRLYANDKIKIGSKKFTESVILGEIVSQLIESNGQSVNHRKSLGGTRVLWNGLLNGEIDLYPEYTGTIQQEILHKQEFESHDQLRSHLEALGVGISEPLGFNNTYAIGMKEELAEQMGIVAVSDLQNHPDLRLGFTNEFMDREDGWKGLKSHYRLPQSFVRGLDHDLAYRGLASGSIDVIDMYSTDAEISYYGLRALKDDQHYFPRYDAVILYRKNLETDNPSIVYSIKRIENRIDESNMISMNSAVKLEGIFEGQMASEFLRKHFQIQSDVHEETLWQRLGRNTANHLALVAISLSAAILFAIPLGLVSIRFEGAGKIILGIVGVIQTIPSLALLVFMIPLLGIGGPPAVTALFLYSLLPIVRNTYTGLKDIPSTIIESAHALGLPSFVRLKKIELPLASRTILAGIKTSAVINIGTATLGALIGAGGYGQPILTGIRLDDIGLILEGAVPAAILALLVQGLFDLSEKLFVPKGLRL